MANQPPPLRHGPLPEPIDVVDSLAFEWAAVLVQRGAVASLTEDDLWVRAPRISRPKVPRMESVAAPSESNNKTIVIISSHRTSRNMLASTSSPGTTRRHAISTVHRCGNKLFNAFQTPRVPRLHWHARPQFYGNCKGFIMPAIYLTHDLWNWMNFVIKNAPLIKM